MQEIELFKHRLYHQLLITCASLASFGSRHHFEAAAVAGVKPIPVLLAASIRTALFLGTTLALQWHQRRLPGEHPVLCAARSAANGFPSVGVHHASFLQLQPVYCGLLRTVLSSCWDENDVVADLRGRNGWQRNIAAYCHSTCKHWQLAHKSSVLQPRA